MMKMIEPFNIGDLEYKSYEAMHLMIEAEEDHMQTEVISG